MIPQQTPLLPEPAPEPPTRRGEGLLVAVAAAAGAAVVIAGLMGFQQWRADNINSEPVAAASGDNTSDPSDTATTSTPSQPPSSDADPGSTLAPTMPPSELEPESDSDPESDLEPEDSADDALTVDVVPCPAQFDGVICDAADFVQQARGRPFKRFPNVELLDDVAFDAAVVEDLDESKPEFIEQEVLLKSLGLIPLDLDLFATFESLIQSGVVGFYDPDTERLVVRGGDFDLYSQAILVHELVHAFDDQWFDLGRDEFEDDAGYGYLAVIEGNASRVEELWRDRLTGAEAQQLQQQEFSALSPDDLNFMLSLPQVILTLQISPYQDGERYVSRLAAQGGEAAVDEKLLVPPESSEQVLNPERSAADLQVVDVDVPPATGLLVDDGTLGELLLESWLGIPAANGWGGDRYVIWEAGQQTCFAVDVAADSDNDLLEIADAARQWAFGRSSRQVEAIDSDGRAMVRISGCY